MHFSQCEIFLKERLLTLDYNDLCLTPSGIDHMTIVIVSEVLLLVLVIGKLAYDVRQYNQTGELPWLARHICLGVSYSGIKFNGQNRDWHPDTTEFTMQQ